MKCLICGSATRIIETRQGTDVTYRQRVCVKCGNKVYTEEFIVIEDDEFRKDFAKLSRWRNQTKTIGGCDSKKKGEIYEYYYK